MHKYEKVINKGFYFIFIFIFMVCVIGCSFLNSGKSAEIESISRNEAGNRDSILVANSAGEVAPGDPKYLNIEITRVTSDVLSSRSSIFYDPNRSNTEYLADNFLPEELVQSAASAVPATKPVVKSTTIPVTTGKDVPKTTTNQKTTPSVPGSNNLNARLAAARARKDKAFEEYTNISTGKTKGDSQKALKEYQEALAALRKLEAEAGK
jgi:hypothetical protein